jgi:MFS family permease
VTRIAATAPSANQTTRASGLVLVILLAAGLTYSLSQTLILPAIPALAERLGAGQAAVSWLITSYLLAAAVSTPLVGKLGDLYGRGRMLAVVAGIFCAGSVLCALTGSLELAIAGRVLQGVAGGVFPLAYGVIRDSFPPGRMMTAIGALSVSLGVGAAAGPPIAGVLTDHAGASSVFWIGMVGAVPALAAPLIIRDAPSGIAPRLDLLGAAGLSVVLVCLLLAITRAPEWGIVSAPVLVLLAVSAVLLVAWTRLERRLPEPLVDLGLMRDRTVSLSNAAALFVGAGSFTAFAAIPLFAQTPSSAGFGFGLSVAESGLLLVPHGVLMMVFAPIAGHLCERTGSRPTLLAGAATNAASAGLLVVAHGDPAWVLISSAGLGVGQALALAGLANLVVAAVAAHDVGIVTGMNMVMRTIGMALGAAASAAILAATVVGSTGLASEGGYVVTFVFAAAASLGGFACSLAIPRRATAANVELVAPPAAACP